MYVNSELSTELASTLKEEFPNAKVVYRDSEDLPWHVVLFIKMYKVMQFFNSNLSRFTFVVGQYIVLPSKNTHEFDPHNMRENVYKIICHEVRHLRQDRDNFLWKLRYLIWPMPFLITERGYRWERDAYKTTMMAEYQLYGYVSDQLIDHLVKNFTGPNYLFMDVRKKKVRDDFLEFRRKLESGEKKVTLP